MVIKDEDCAIFQADGNDEHAWVSFPSFGDLIAADLPDGIRLARDWDELEVVIVDSTWVLPNEWDIADLEKRFSISLGKPAYAALDACCVSELMLHGNGPRKGADPLERTLLPCARYKSRSLGMLAMSATKVSNSSGQAFDPECLAP